MIDEENANSAPPTTKKAADRTMTPQERRKRAMVMKRKKSVIKMGKKRQSRLRANTERLEQRAKRRARAEVAKTLSNGKSKGEMSYSARASLERKLKNKEGIIRQKERKLLPQLRKAEAQRMSGGGGNKKNVTPKGPAQRKESTVMGFSDYLKESNHGKSMSIVMIQNAYPSLAVEPVLEASLEGMSRFEKRRVWISTHSDDILLEGDDVLKYFRKMYPRHARVMLESSHNNIIEILNDAYDNEMTTIKVYCSESDRPKYEALIERYNGVDNRKGFFHFQEGHLKVVGVKIDSRSKNARRRVRRINEAVRLGNYQEFVGYISPAFDHAKELFNDLRNAMNLTEMKNFHFQSNFTGENDPETLIAEEITVGTQVRDKISDSMAQVIHVGPNYAVLKSSDGDGDEQHRKVRRWLSDLELVTKT